MPLRSVILLCLISFLTGASFGSEAKIEPFLDSQWRAASLNNPFRSGRTLDDQAIVLRTIIGARIKTNDKLSFNVEVADARSYFNADDALPTSGQVNPLDILEANLEWRFQSASGLQGSVRLGRLTKDLGSRRLVARNIFRNTINAFEGIDASLKFPGDKTLTLLALNPVNRLPSRATDRAENRLVMDRSDDDRIFLGVHYDQPIGPLSARLETYLFGLFESDDANEATRNRRLLTPGFRLRRAPSSGMVDFELETAVNLGTARASRDVADVNNVSVFGVLTHAELGYRFEGDWQPRLALAFNHASGENPNSNHLDGFDGLFGIQRNDYGNTGLFGALRRNNLETITAKASFNRAEDGLDGKIAWIFARLASRTDGWSGTGLADPTGASGRSIGQVVDARLRKWLKKDHVRLEIGTSILFKGRFASTAPGAPDKGDTLYTYVQISTRL